MIARSLPVQLFNFARSNTTIRVATTLPIWKGSLIFSIQTKNYFQSNGQLAGIRHTRLMFTM